MADKRRRRARMLAGGLRGVSIEVVFVVGLILLAGLLAYLIVLVD